ncbi:unnamed protein product, partial [Polarella glacialis]
VHVRPKWRPCWLRPQLRDLLLCALLVRGHLCFCGRVSWICSGCVFLNFLVVSFAPICFVVPHHVFGVSRFYVSATPSFLPLLLHHSPESGKALFFRGLENYTRNIPFPTTSLSLAKPCSSVDLRIRHFSAGWQHSIDEEKQIKASVVRFEPGSLG